MKTIQAAMAHLAAQPDIAEFLRREGVKGERYAMHSCPVARYLQRETKRHDVLDSFSETVGDVPSNVYEFARNFDRGIFPDLIA